MDRYKISVIIPTYKRPKLLLSCLNSLENQSLEKTDFEVIIVSDGIDNDTRDAVSIYKVTSELNISYYNTPGKKGPAAARNIGWRHAESPLIAFTDDDCLPQTGWLKAWVEAYKVEDLIAYTGKTIVPLDESSEPTDFALNLSHLQEAEFITANCMVTRNALQAVDGFDERFEIAWREDSDLQFKLITRKIPVVKISNAVVIHPVRPDIPWAVSIKEQRKGLYDALLYKKHPDLYKRKVKPKIILTYYFIVLVALICLISLLAGWFYIAAVTFLVVFIMLFSFFMMRIKKTRKTLDHILDMFVTSMVLPFVSVYWRIVGSLRYKVLFLY